jgi:RNA polymerase sigma-70 factor (family 1)
MRLAIDSDDDTFTWDHNNPASSFTLVYRKFWPSLYNTAYKRLKDRDQCQDIVQNVFTDLWNRKEKISIKNLEAYLHTAVRYQVYKQLLKAPSNSAFFSVLEKMLQSPYNADDHVLTAELSKLVELWIDALPEKRKKIFLMHYYEHLSTQEIAARLNISQKTVQNQLNRASIYIRARFTLFFLLTALEGFFTKF